MSYILFHYTHRYLGLGVGNIILPQQVAHFQRRKINYASKDVGTKKLAFFQASMSGKLWVTCTIYFTVKPIKGKRNLATVSGKNKLHEAIASNFSFFAEEKGLPEE